MRSASDYRHVRDPSVRVCIVPVVRLRKASTRINVIIRTLDKSTRCICGTLVCILWESSRRLCETKEDKRDDNAKRNTSHAHIYSTTVLHVCVTQKSAPWCIACVVLRCATATLSSPPVTRVHKRYIFDDYAAHAADTGDDKDAPRLLCGFPPSGAATAHRAIPHIHN